MVVVIVTLTIRSTRLSSVLLATEQSSSSVYNYLYLRTLNKHSPCVDSSSLNSILLYLIDILISNRCLKLNISTMKIYYFPSLPYLNK
jgi:hypothetical protein